MCGATWWLAQDFGVFGGFATDPSAGLPLGLLIATALPHWTRSPAAVPETVPPGGATTGRGSAQALARSRLPSR